MSNTTFKSIIETQGNTRMNIAANTEHATFTRALWAKEAVSGNTTLGYNEWVADEVELAAKAELAKAQAAEAETRVAHQRARPISDETKQRIQICLEMGMNSCQIAKVIDCNLRSVERALREMGRPVTQDEVRCIRTSLKLMANIVKFRAGETDKNGWMAEVRAFRESVSDFTCEQISDLADRLEVSELGVK